MKLQVFNGGQSSRMRPQFIQASEGVEYENLDYDLGSLAPVMMPKETPISVKKYHQWFNAGSQWIDSDTPRDYVEFQKTMFWTDRVNPPQKRSDTGITSNLGIKRPYQLVLQIEKTKKKQLD